MLNKHVRNEREEILFETSRKKDQQFDWEAGLVVISFKYIDFRKAGSSSSLRNGRSNGPKRWRKQLCSVKLCQLGCSVGIDHGLLY